MASCIVSALFLLFSCKNEVASTEESTSKKVEYDIYQPSEMASLMNAMYAYNLQIKNQIISGETPANLPIDLIGFFLILIMILIII